MSGSIPERQRRPVYAVCPATNRIVAIFPSIVAAGRCGFDRRHIWHSLMGVQAAHRGLGWIDAEEQR